MEEHTGRAELGEPARLLDEHLGLSALAGAVHQPGLELALRLRNRLGGVAEVGDVVERVVQPEDVDPVLGGGGDEPPREVVVDRALADEELAAQGEPEGRRRARLDHADPLPRALDAALDRAVEAAPAAHFEVGESRPVEDLGEAQDLRRRDTPGKRLLPEQADGRVDECRHRRDLTAA